MVVDLVMSERERLARIRLVGQNRELRQQHSLVESPTREDAALVELVTSLRYQLLATPHNYLRGESSDDRIHERDSLAIIASILYASVVTMRFLGL
jgi:hypothetical protein